MPDARQLAIEALEEVVAECERSSDIETLRWNPEKQQLEEQPHSIACDRCRKQRVALAALRDEVSL